MNRCDDPAETHTCACATAGGFVSVPISCPPPDSARSMSAASFTSTCLLGAGMGGTTSAGGIMATVSTCGASRVHRWGTPGVSAGIPGEGNHVSSARKAHPESSAIKRNCNANGRRHFETQPLPPKWTTQAVPSDSGIFDRGANRHALNHTPCA